MTVFFLTSGNDTFPGVGQINSGNDIIYGGQGNDSIRGGSGNDVIAGDTGADILFGEDGDDTLTGGFLSGAETLDGGAGNDVAVLSFDDVTGAGGQSVRVNASFLATSFQVLLDGVVNSFVYNCEYLQIDSGNANDRITGGALADIIQSLGGNDRLYAGAGDDFVSKSWGTYDLDGGQGNDRLSVANTDNGAATGALLFDARVGTIASGTATTGAFRRFEAYNVTGTAKGDTIHTGTGIDNVNGQAGDDLIFGYGGNDLLDGGLGNDVLDGGDGNDTLRAGEIAGPFLPGIDTIDGGAGDDLIVISSQTGIGTRTYTGASFIGGAGNDTLQIQTQFGFFDFSGATLGGIETLAATGTDNGNVILTAAQLNGFTDVTARMGIILTTNDAIVLDGVFNGVVSLAFGGQSVDASAATITASPSLILVNGGSGNDTIVGFTQGGQMLGGYGDDIMTSTYTGTGIDTLQGGFGNDTLTGSARNNNLDGRDGEDMLSGLDGDDALFGGRGNDTLLGGKGNDYLAGDEGRDRITGGSGADLFSFTSLNNSTPDAKGADVITDFTVDPAAGAAYIDRINLLGFDADPSTFPYERFTFVGTSAFSAVGQVRVTQDGADTIVELNTFGTGAAEMSIRLNNVLAGTLSAADFLLA